MSHVSAIPLLSIRITLLKTLSGVHDTSVLRGALPLLTPLLEDSDETTWLAMATGIYQCGEAVAAGRVTASGIHTDLSSRLPLHLPRLA